MKIISCSILLIFVLITCPSCDKEVKNLQDEIKILKDENNFLKAENVALKKELEELYKRISEKDLVKQKPAATGKEEKLHKETPIKISEKTEAEKAKQPQNNKTGR